ncbi:hypothetical protein [Caulobacter segnis]|uniref:Response regulatory domain-containing protein n=1 Tax=Caulobacter segnis TaxID=88688 RepID=A0A2W5WBG4_9CAUL|nr:hypothetical protein [Caulobacter segnis]PZR30898.1 MAG: hypothetical protein DI526_21220 [Caulobacter segnis]
MNDDINETILLICDDETRATRLITAFDEARIQVIGPFPTAGLTLAVTAHAGPTVALLASETTGRRSAAELAQSLQTNWGVRSMLLDEAAHDEVETVGWRAPDSQVAGIRRALAKAFAPA